ncbi:Glycosyltransferase like family protein [Mucilaginibacter sp. OK268]|uniref:glycosyltransferase n=1 Tax=Mucilaginibacter sp. OK268 TaxID=1881048 RepID=UPI0008836D26|nr:glycosyltransferase [Mucilaginibacter sp. OK268]SDP94409.1 Glycosyltransferase like family protein [Mucilaginibacter sp. OK268]
MISIIICSANKNLLSQVSENISTTIGVPYEIIATDNSEGKQGICAVYNRGILKAQYDILCFMHEDVLIKTNNWGQKIIQSFHNDTELGLVGVAGSSYKPVTPSGWGGMGVDTTYTNLLQSFKHKKKQTKHVHRNPNNETISEVACVDGVWLCTTRKIARGTMFDENTFWGFHGYDIDFSLSVGQKYKVAVTFEILLDHFSEGHYDRTWMNENLKLHNKWSEHLPVNIEPLTPKQVIYIEKTTFKDFIEQLIKFEYPISTAFNMLWKNNKFLTLDLKLFLKLNFYILKKYLTLDSARVNNKQLAES